MGGWSYRKDITIDSTQVDGELTDFPVVVHLDSDSDLAAHALSSGDDIRFEDANGTQLSHEIESYDGSTGTLWAHVKLPSLSASSDTTIYIYYGKDSASNQESVADVWSNGFEAVYHLDGSASGTGNADVYKDSTSNSFDGDDEVSATGKRGQVADGQDFDGSDDRVELPNLGLDVSQSITASLWVQGDDLSNGAQVLARFDGSSKIFTLNINGKLEPSFRLGDINGADHNLFGSAVSEGTPIHLLGRWDAPSDTASLYVNASQDNSASGAIDDFVTSDGPWIGQRNDGIKPLDGFADEVRLSNISRSDAWISTTYNNQNDPLSFYSVGAEEALKLSKRAIATASSTATTSSTQTDTRDAPTSAVGETSVSATVRRPADGVVNATATTELTTTLQTPSIAALTPTALTTEVVTTATEQARAGVTTAQSTAIETKSRVFKFADATAAATVSLDVSVPPLSTPATALVTAAPRAAFTPRETTPHQRALDGSSDTDAAYETDSDRVRYDNQTDEINYDTR